MKYAAIESGLSFDNATFSVIPNAPSNFSSQIIGPSAAPNTKYIKYTITAPTSSSCNCTSPTQGLYNYYVYVKKGTEWRASDFNENYSAYAGITPGSSQDVIITDPSKVPNASYRIAVKDKDTTVGQYVPPEGGRYSFKVFSANAEGGTSDSLTHNSNEVPPVNPIIDTILKNLRLSTDTRTTNASATNDSNALKQSSSYLDLNQKIRLLILLFMICVSTLQIS